MSVEACFAATAGRLAGMAGVAFGWTPEAFWAATPAELAALAEAAKAGSGEAPPLGIAELAQLRERLCDG